MIGIIAAVIEEVEAIKEEMLNVIEEVHYGITFYKGKIENKEIVFVQSGIGKVNAAITTTLLIEKFNVEKIIFSGVAGSLNKNINVGDVVIGEDVVQHDVDATEFDYKKGQIPQLPVYSFQCDDELIKKVKTIENKNLNLSYGRILTGDQFISGKDIKIKLGEQFNGLCVDMESGAVAQVCYKLNKKFLIIRSISDSVSDSSGMEYDVFVKLAAKNSKEILKEILK